MEMPSVDGTTNNDLSINTQRMPDFATSVQYNWNSNSHIKLGAIIRSMTPKERENPQILNASRKRRIAAGCGLEVVDVNRLLKSFEMLQQMTKAMTKQFSGGKMPRNMRKMMKKGGKGGMGGLGGMMPGMGGGKFPGLPF